MIEQTIKDTWTIYALVDPETDQIRYVGFTSCRPGKRLNQHCCTKRDPNTHKSNWIKSLLSRGLRPVIRTLETGVGDWAACEKKWITQLRAEGHPLTNLSDGGEGTVGCQFSEERKRKISIAHRGRIISQEQREKISKALMGRKRDPEVHARIIAKMKGRKVSEETRRKISIANKGKIRTPEVIARQIAGRQWYRPTRATVEKRIATQKANGTYRRKRSELQRKKIRDGQRRRWGTTPELVRQIRERAKEPGIKRRHLAEEFGISRQHVWLILTGRTAKDIV